MDMKFLQELKENKHLKSTGISDEVIKKAMAIVNKHRLKPR